jgi:hypothetical protein
MTAPSASSFLMGSGAKSAKFETIGAVVGGVIVDDPQVVQQKDIKTGAPKTWDDGNPMMQLVVKVKTDERDPDDAEDDGVRAIYIKAQMRQAVADAVRKAGAKDLEVGGTLKVKFTGTEPASTKGFNDKKIYAAQYEKPAASSGSFLGTDDQAPF